VEALKVTEPNGTFHSKVIHVNASGTYPTIASAITALAGGSGHIIIDDGYSAVVPSFTLGVIPCQNANTPWAQILEMGANVSLYTTGSIKLECGGYVYGDNRDGAVITPCTGTNTPVAGCSAFTYASGIAYAIDMGDFVNNSALIDARVEGVTININLPNSVGIRGRGLNENSYIGRNAIENDTNVGILIDGSTIVTANFKIDDNQILDNNASTAYGIELINAGTVRMTRNTVSSNTLIQSTGACFYITGSNAGYFSGNDLADGHCEKHNDGVLVDGNPGLNIFSLDVNGGAGGSNALRIASTANTNVTGYWMRNNTPFNNVVLNQVARCPLTLGRCDYRLSFYHWVNCLFKFLVRRPWLARIQHPDRSFADNHLWHQRQRDPDGHDLQWSLSGSHANQRQRGNEHCHKLHFGKSREPNHRNAHGNGWNDLRRILHAQLKEDDSLCSQNQPKIERIP